MQNHTIDQFGAFFGADLPPETLDYLMFQVHGRDDKPHYDTERQLFETKWFDYRFMHATTATYLYAQRYREVFKVIYARHIDRKAAPYVKGLKAEDMFDSKAGQLKGLWRGRMIADMLGMPYEVFIELALERAMRWKRAGGHLPQPCHLYSDEIVNHVHAAWEERIRGRMMLAEDPRYRLDRFAGTPAQLAHQNWVCDLLRLRSPETRRALLGQYLNPQGFICRDLAVTRFGEEAVNEAIAAA